MLTKLVIRKQRKTGYLFYRISGLYSGVPITMTYFVTEQELRPTLLIDNESILFLSQNPKMLEDLYTTSNTEEEIEAKLEKIFGVKVQNTKKVTGHLSLLS